MGKVSWLGLVFMVWLASPPAWADSLRYLQIGTGPPGETHFPLGGLISSAISNPPGLRPCGKGGNCGVPGLIAMASATNGSVVNVQEIAAGRLDMAVVQADIALMAYQGEGPFDGAPLRGLRSVARIGADQLQVVVRRDGPIKSIHDLKGKRVSLGEKGSGTLIHARQLLAAYGLKESDLKVDYMRSALAADAMVAGKLDGFIVMDGAPSPAVAELADSLPITLLPITGPAMEKLRQGNTLLHIMDVPANSYPGQDQPVPSLSVAVTLVASAKLSDDLVLGICKALWSPTSQQLLSDHQTTPDPMALGSALNGMALPLHPGAQRFYFDKGVIE